MNDEIKEILDRLEGRKNWYLHQQKNNGVFNDEDYMAYMVLDYITNLQQENERLKELLDKRVRIEKAVEYIKEQYKWIEESDKRWQPVLDNKKILNILNGRSDE